MSGGRGRLGWAAAAWPLVLLWALPLFGQGGVRVRATVSADDIRVGETTTLEVTVETPGVRPEEIDLPPIPTGLDVVGSRDYSRIQFSSPGGRTRVIRREIVLSARTPGRFRIRPVRVQVAGRSYRTGSVSVTVRPAPGGSGAGGREVMLRASLRPDTAYVGQQVTLHVEALFSDDVRRQLRRAPEYEPPSPSGFWIRDLPDPARQSRTVGGSRYEVRAFERAYFPLAAGVRTLPPARLTYEVRRGFLYTPETHELETDSLRLVVLAPPAAGRPPSFTGAVGRFRIRARVEPATVPAGEAAVLTVEVEGEGNVKALPAPRLAEVDGVEFYPPSEDAEVQLRDGRIAGVKRFRWILVPSRPGRLQIPAIAYGYFDPAREAYAVARADVAALQVLPGDAPADDGEGPVTLRALKPAPAGGGLRWVRSPGFALVQLLPILGVLAVVVRRRSAGRARAPSGRELRRRRRELLEEMRRMAGSDDRDFFRRLEREMRRWLADRLAAPELRSAPPDELRSALEALDIDSRAARGTAELLVRLDRACYEPEPPGPDVRTVYLQAAGRVLEMVDTGAPRPRRLWRASALVVAGLLGAAAAAPALDAVQEDDFTAGVAAYEAGDYRQAVEQFHAFVTDRPADANGWYNLGNAYFQAGQQGRAVWAWLHALQRAPRDGDVRYNLEAVGASPALVDRATPWLPLTTEEALLLAGVGWILGGLMLLSVFRGRRRRWAVLGGTLVAVSILAGSALAESRARPPLAVVLAPATPLQAAPSVRAQTMRTLDAGTGVDVVDRRDGWVRVRLTVGTEGWVEAAGLGTL